MALATCLNDMLNDRIVNFYYDENEYILYFSTFNNNQKVVDFKANEQIAFTTIFR